MRRGRDRMRNPSRNSDFRFRERIHATLAQGSGRAPRTHSEDAPDVLGVESALAPLLDERGDVAALVRVVAVGRQDAEDGRPRLDLDEVVLVLVQLLPSPPVLARRASSEMSHRI